MMRQLLTMIQTHGKKDGPRHRICFNLWYKANHAEESGNNDQTVDEYFEQEVLFMDDLDGDTRQKAWQMLHDYMDHMPRWTLKGYAPAEVSPTEPFSVPFSHCT